MPKLGNAFNRSNGNGDRRGDKPYNRPNKPFNKTQSSSFGPKKANWSDIALRALVILDHEMSLTGSNICQRILQDDELAQKLAPETTEKENVLRLRFFLQYVFFS